MENIPKDIVLYMEKFLPFQTLYNLSMTSKKFHKLLVPSRKLVQLLKDAPYIASPRFKRFTLNKEELKRISVNHKFNMPFRNHPDFKQCCDFAQILAWKKQVYPNVFRDWLIIELMDEKYLGGYFYYFYGEGMASNQHTCSALVGSIQEILTFLNKKNSAFIRKTLEHTKKCGGELNINDLNGYVRFSHRKFKVEINDDEGLKLPSDDQDSEEDDSSSETHDDSKDSKEEFCSDGEYSENSGYSDDYEDTCAPYDDSSIPYNPCDNE